MEKQDGKIAVQKILLPLKFSQEGSSAFSMALNLARCCIARLDVLSVLQPDSGSDPSEKEDFKQEIETAIDRFEEIHLPLLGNFRSYQFAW